MGLTTGVIKANKGIIAENRDLGILCIKVNTDESFFDVLNTVLLEGTLAEAADQLFLY